MTGTKRAEAIRIYWTNLKLIAKITNAKQSASSSAERIRLTKQIDTLQIENNNLEKEYNL